MAIFGLKALVGKEIDKKVNPVSDVANAASKSAATANGAIAAKGTFYKSATTVTASTEEISGEKLKAGDLIYDAMNDTLWICIEAGTNVQIDLA